MFYRGGMTWPVRWDELPLARASVDRAAHRRAEPGLLEALAGSARARVVLAHAGTVAVRGPRLVLLPADDPLVSASWRGSLRIFLGEDAEGEYLGLVLRERPELPGTAWESLRTVGEGFDAREAGLVATTVALAAWHESHRYCPRCGAPTRPSQAGWQRRCLAEGDEHFPRTDPAVIMAVTDEDDRLLLGHAASWPEGRYSTLAGFVEAGESAEQAVRREVREEAGLEVLDVEYRGSQTWPFPASLMLAYRARVAGGEPVVDGDELTAAQWFDRPALEAAARSGEVLLPGRASIARALVEDWYGGRLP